MLPTSSIGDKQSTSIKYVLQFGDTEKKEVTVITAILQAQLEKLVVLQRTALVLENSHDNW